MTEYKEQMERYCHENPNNLTPERIAKIRHEMDHPQENTVSDDYLDFRLWCGGLPSRQESFAAYIVKEAPPDEVKHILEVGGGETGRLSFLLAKKGYCMTCMDPKLEIESEAGIKAGIKAGIEAGIGAPVQFKKERFDFRTAQLSGYDYVVGQEPCEAAEHIVRACVREKIPFMVLLCGVPHRLISGETPEDVWAWYQYLREIDPESTEMKILNLYGLVKTVVIQSRKKVLRERIQGQQPC